MDRRKSILIPTSGSYQNAASMIIYLLNIIKGLNNIVDDKNKPNIILYHDNETPIDEFKKINYPHISYFNFKNDVPFIKRVINLISRKFLNRNIFKTYNKKVDYIFPALPDNSFVDANELVFWKADFQEKYLPHFFTANDINYSESFFTNLLEYQQSKLVLSSQDAYNSFKQFYPNHQNPVFVLPFVSFLKIKEINFQLIKEKFQIKKPYFIVCNQFWPHKNHIRVLEAISQLKNKELPFQIVFTGNTSSYRNENIFKVLKDFIEKNQLIDDLIITGFIDRDEQIALIKNAIAVVQPSYFEGWSTVIEDAKALNKYVIASNINVNIEQINKDCTFFNPDNADELSNILSEFDIKYKDNDRKYNEDIQQFSEKLIKLFRLNEV